MRNHEHYSDPTPARALRRGKIRVLNEKDLEKMDSHRYIPTLKGWSEAEEQEALIQWANAMTGISHAGEVTACTQRREQTPSRGGASKEDGGQGRSAGSVPPLPSQRVLWAVD